MVLVAGCTFCCDLGLTRATGSSSSESSGIVYLTAALRRAGRAPGESVSRAVCSLGPPLWTVTAADSLIGAASSRSRAMAHYAVVHTRALRCCIQVRY